MKINIKNILLLIVLVSGREQLVAQDPAVKAVTTAVEKLRIAMETPDSAALSGLTSSSLTYGHSNGLIEDKPTFIASLLSGKFRFLKIELSDQQIIIDRDLAIVRHKFRASTHDAEKPEGEIRLGIMMVWKKRNGKWILAARQSCKL